MSADDIHIVVMTSDFNSCKKPVTLQLNKVNFLENQALSSCSSVLLLIRHLHLLALYLPFYPGYFDQLKKFFQRQFVIFDLEFQNIILHDVPASLSF